MNISGEYSRHRFNWLGHSVAVSIDQALKAATEVEAMRPYFEIIELGASETVDFEMTRSPVDLEFRSAGNVTGASFPLYFGERGERFRRLGGGAVIVDDQRHRAIVVEADKTTFGFLTGNDDDRRMIGRLVREKLVQRALFAGGARMHAAMAANDGRGVVIVGTSGAGKTSLLLQMLQMPGAALVGADRIVVPNASDLAAHGVPIAIQVGSELVGRVEGLRAMATVARTRQFPRSPRVTAEPFSKVSFLPRELADAMQIPLMASANIDLVVIPDLGDRPAAAPAVRLVGREEREEVLAAELLHPDPAFPACVVGENETSPNGTVVARLLTVPWIGVSGSYTDLKVADAVLACVSAKPGASNA